MRVAAHTLGCKLNYAETSDTLRRLAEQGNEIVPFDTVADLYIINTCTVTAVAEKKCRNAIRQAVAQNPDAEVIVMGCMAQADREAVARIPGVTAVYGNERKRMLAYSSAGTGADNERTRIFFKIQDGCDYFCTYCAIPLARGRSRSATIEETLCAMRKIADENPLSEVVLTGVNTGTFGQQHGETLLDLLRGLDAIESVSRYRISSIEPNLLTDEMIDFIAHSRAFLPHFHIPLQAGSDKVLRLMHRRYDTALYRDKLLYIKRQMPDACIAADVMAGFNGETEEEFAKVLEYVGSLPISYLHVFTYSDRPGTAALRMGEKIPMQVRREHTARLLELSERKHKAFIDSQMGKVRPVLWEATDHGGTMQGWTDNYIRVSRPYDKCREGMIEQVEITEQNIVYER
ncbi:MAG: MiaB/RimO family radical SAM methylthiotransferase [Bacteroidales bacterium]|nr:MiaB/RimO family radical SAM methylthiotransferase [Bacteroidales bacterium]